MSKLTGTHIQWEDHLIKVKVKKIKASTISPQPAIKEGIRQEDGSIQLVKSATIPRFREDIATTVIERFREQDVFGTALFLMAERTEKDLGYPDQREPTDSALYKTENMTVLFRLAFAAAQEEPLDGYSRAKVDLAGNRIDPENVQKFVSRIVDDVEEFEEFPYTNKTQIFPVNEATVQPRIYWDEMLQSGDMLNEVYASDDVGRFALWALADKLNNWPTDPSNPESPTEEMMIVIQGVYLTSGSTQEYIVLISPKRIIGDEGEKFVLVMKCCQSNVAYKNAMVRPKEGETPVTPQTEQKPLRLASFADMVKAMQK